GILPDIGRGPRVEGPLSEGPLSAGWAAARMGVRSSRAHDMVESPSHAAADGKVYADAASALADIVADGQTLAVGGFGLCGIPEALIAALRDSDRKSTRLNSSHVKTSYAVF